MCIVHMLELSTAHISKETASVIDDSRRAHAYAKAEYGWFVWVPPKRNELIMTPDDLKKVYAYAREKKATWILFDCDADLINDLPIFEW